MFEMISAQTLLTVAQCGSFSKAAEALFLTKSAVKRRVDALEAEIGTPLFARGSGGVELTPAGEVFVAGAERLLREQDALRVECLRAAERASRRVIRVAVYTDFVFPLTQYCSDHYLDTHPADTIVPVTTDFSHVYAGLRAGEYDVALCPFLRPRDSAGLMSIATFCCRYVGLVSKSGPLAHRSSLSREDLASHEVVIHSNWYTQGGIEEWSKGGKPSFDVLPTTRGVSEMQAVCARGGIYLFPESDASQYPFAALALEDSAVMSGSITCTTNASPAVIEFVRYSEAFVHRFTDPDGLALLTDWSAYRERLP